jgi:hypothetical protein
MAQWLKWQWLNGSTAAGGDGQRDLSCIGTLWLKWLKWLNGSNGNGSMAQWVDNSQNTAGILF